MNVGLSTAGWFRLYTDSASRTADASRSVGEDPTAGSGVHSRSRNNWTFYFNKNFTICAGGNMDNTSQYKYVCCD